MPYGSRFRGRYAGRRGGRGGGYRRGGAGYTRNVGYYGRYKSAMGMIPTARQWGGELKFVDMTRGDTAASQVLALLDDPAANAVFDIPTGTGESARIGRKILIKSLAMTFKVSTGDIASAAFLSQETQRVRIMIVLDKQANGAVASVSDVLDTSIVADEVDAYNNLSNKNRFVTLMDKKIGWVPTQYDNAATPHYNQKQLTIKFYKKFNNLPIEFSGVNGDSAEIASNQLLMLTTESVTAATALTPAIDVRGRLRFTDG